MSKRRSLLSSKNSVFIRLKATVFITVFVIRARRFIRGRRLYEDDGMITYFFNFKKQKYVFSAFLKSNFLFSSQIHNLHVNTTAIHKINKALMSDMLS